ncbi:MAG: mechanosensitive ion channel family protein, partial [Waddliaceae bacterium]
MSQDNTLMLWGQVILVLCIIAILGFVVRPILNKIKQIERNPAWATTLCDSLYIPLPWLIWGAGFFLALEALVETTDVLISSEIVVTIRNVFFVLFATWVLLSWKTKYEKVLKRRIRKKESKAQDEVLIMTISRVLSVFIYIVAGLVLLEIFEIPLTALLAFGGIGGVAIGFAGKDVVANFFGGLMIHINRPFSMGERIRSPNKNFEGIIEDIGWYATRIRTLDRKPTYIPNALFIDAMIENFSRMYNQRIKQT